MFLPSTIPELISVIDLESLRVHPPSNLLLLCGGKVDVKENFPPSFRDAFSKLCDKPILNQHVFLIPEEFDPFDPHVRYSNWLDFENDLAQISDVVLVFSESFGSAAELGAFSVQSDVSGKILVGIDSKTYEESSFVKNGPIKALTDAYGSSSLMVMENEQIGIGNLKDLSNINMSRFQRYLVDALQARAERKDEHTTFNSDRNGHRIKLICGLVQHYGALDLVELEVMLACFNITITADELQKLVFCASICGWVGFRQFGSQKFVYNRGGKQAIQYASKTKFIKDRWLVNVIEYVKEYEPDRWGAIQCGMGEQI